MSAAAFMMHAARIHDGGKEKVVTEACELLAASDVNAVADVGIETQLTVERYVSSS